MIILHLRAKLRMWFLVIYLKLPRLESTAWCTGLPSHTMEKAMQSYPQAFSTIRAPRQMSLLCQTLCCHSHTATGPHQAKEQPGHECLCDQGSCWPQDGHAASAAQLTWLCTGEGRWTMDHHVDIMDGIVNPVVVRG